MTGTLGIAGGIISCIGALFLFLASLGILRMPDVYNRMQAGTKATTLGTILMLSGIAIGRPEWMGKLILVILFLVLTNPISSHALARAAHYAKIPLAKGSVRDELGETDTADDEGERND
jgi:multicomponent Na+:H+ antiporter subunit G